MHECNNDFQASLAASLYSCLIITGRFDAGICVACAMFSGDRGNQDIYLSPSHSHTGPMQHLSLAAKPRNYTEFHLFKKWMASLCQLSSQKRPYKFTRSFDPDREEASRLQTIVTFRALHDPCCRLRIIVSTVMPIEATSLLYVEVNGKDATYILPQSQIYIIDGIGCGVIREDSPPRVTSTESQWDQILRNHE